jgi:hypothetical protein
MPSRINPAPPPLLDHNHPGMPTTNMGPKIWARHSYPGTRQTALEQVAHRPDAGPMSATGDS